MRESLPTTTPNKFIIIEVYYNIGGSNYFTGTTEARGYYIVVRPEEIRDGMRIATAFSGTKQLVLAVQRQSPKSLAKAIELASPLRANLISHILAKNSLELAPTEVK
jgi:hypothetical protein